MPQRVPASWPAFWSECTHRPTSSNAGWATMPGTAWIPTVPVAHWMTLIGPSFAMATCSPVWHSRCAPASEREPVLAGDLGGVGGAVEQVGQERLVTGGG